MLRLPLWSSADRPTSVDTPGPTYISYTPDGASLVTAGSNNAIRVYNTGSVGEPVTIDDCQELNTAVTAGVGLTFGLSPVAGHRWLIRASDRATSS